MTDNNRYVAYLKGSAQPEPSDIEVLSTTAGVEIIHRSRPGLILLKCTEEGAEQLKVKLPKWNISPEVTYKTSA